MSFGQSCPECGLVFVLPHESHLGLHPQRLEKVMYRLPLCDLYLTEGVAHKKTSTVKTDRGRINHHIIPLLGRKRVDAIIRADI